MLIPGSVMTSVWGLRGHWHFALHHKNIQAPVSRPALSIEEGHVESFTSTDVPGRVLSWDARAVESVERVHRVRTRVILCFGRPPHTTLLVRLCLIVESGTAVPLLTGAASAPWRPSHAGAGPAWHKILSGMRAREVGDRASKN